MMDTCIKHKGMCQYVKVQMFSESAINRKFEVNGTVYMTSFSKAKL